MFDIAYHIMEVGNFNGIYVEVDSVNKQAINISYIDIDDYDHFHIDDFIKKSNIYDLMYAFEIMVHTFIENGRIDKNLHIKRVGSSVGSSTALKMPVSEVQSLSHPPDDDIWDQVQGLPNPTPTLYGNDALEFLRRIKENQDKPLTLRPVPNIERARELARKHLKDKEKP